MKKFTQRLNLENRIIYFCNKGCVVTYSTLFLARRSLGISAADVDVNYVTNEATTQHLFPSDVAQREHGRQDDYRWVVKVQEFKRVDASQRSNNAVYSICNTHVYSGMSRRHKARESKQWCALASNRLELGSGGHSARDVFAVTPGDTVSFATIWRFLRIKHLFISAVPTCLHIYHMN